MHFESLLWIDDCVTDEKSIFDVLEQTGESSVAADDVGSVCCDDGNGIGVTALFERNQNYLKSYKEKPTRSVRLQCHKLTTMSLYHDGNTCAAYR